MLWFNVVSVIVIATTYRCAVPGTVCGPVYEVPLLWSKVIPSFMFL